VTGTPGDAVWRAILTKRAVRKFAPRSLAPEHLERILRAGRRAGSSKNLQRWDFVVCRDRDHLEELSKVGPWAGHLAGAAVGIALVTPDPAAADAPLSVMFDLGPAAENMMLAAWELGIGSVPATVYEHDLARRHTHASNDEVGQEYALWIVRCAHAGILFCVPLAAGIRETVVV